MKYFPTERPKSSVQPARKREYSYLGRTEKVRKREGERKKTHQKKTRKSKNKQQRGSKINEQTKFRKWRSWRGPSGEADVGRAEIDSFVVRNPILVLSLRFPICWQIFWCLLIILYSIFLLFFVSLALQVHSQDRAVDSYTGFLSSNRNEVVPHLHFSWRSHP